MPQKSQPVLVQLSKSLISRHCMTCKDEQKKYFKWRKLWAAYTGMTQLCVLHLSSRLGSNFGSCSSLKGS